MWRGGCQNAFHVMGIQYPGPILHRKFFPLYGPIRTFLALGPSFSAIQYRTFISVSCLHQKRSALQRGGAGALRKRDPQHVAPFLGGIPPKKWLSRKFAVFHAPVHKICKGFVAPGTKNFIEELIFYQSGIAEMGNVRKFVRQRPHGRGSSENLTLLRGQIWG